MIRKFISGLILLPLAVALVALAAANRHAVRLSLDPFAAGEPALALDAPLFLLLFGALIVGVLIGGLASWPGRRRWRRAARRSEAEAQRFRAAAERPLADAPPSQPRLFAPADRS